uniref:Uncharacterized protein n=1 Tax=Lactuca sativa TaxID=4236 RepID=A0A9R1VR69_LACSA|nr:hypothetical protein LSAT_V11C400200490 [Lactuca sativa]
MTREITEEKNDVGKENLKDLRKEEELGRNCIFLIQGGTKENGVISVANDMLEAVKVLQLLKNVSNVVSWDILVEIVYQTSSCVSTVEKEVIYMKTAREEKTNVSRDIRRDDRGKMKEVKKEEGREVVTRGRAFQRTVKEARDKPDVVSDEFSGLPPDREVEFTIDLAAGSNPTA